MTWYHFSEEAAITNVDNDNFFFGIKLFIVIQLNVQIKILIDLFIPGFGIPL